MAKTYEAMQKNNTIGKVKNGWQYLDLKNRKQTGDLEKKILYFKQKKQFKAFNFTSSRGQEGVSTVLTNLLKYLKHHNSVKKILVIDANLQRPILHTFFNCPNESGITDILADRNKLTDACLALDDPRISFIPAGKDHTAMAGDIDQTLFTEFIKECKEKFDYILIDSAAILTSSDALSTAGAADTSFLVLQSMEVPKEVALKAKSMLLDNECDISGVILNEVEQVIPRWMYKIL